MDKLTSQQRSKCMSRIRSADTKPELIVRRWLWSRGYRYRKNCRRLPGTPDIVLRRYGAAIFVHGCFWHGHESHLRLPKTNVEFWKKKIARNRERDEQNKAKLREMGWSVLTVWECQLRPPVRHATLMEIESFLNRSFLARHGDVKKVRAYSYGEEVVPMAAEPEE